MSGRGFRRWKGGGDWGDWFDVIVVVVVVVVVLPWWTGEMARTMDE